MSLSERLFARFYRTLEAARRAARAPNPRAEAATLEALAPRLRLLACALARVDVELVAAPVGGVRGHRVLVPSVITTTRDRDVNTRLFQLRVAYAAASARLGFVLPGDTASDGGALATLLAVPATLALVRRELPGLGATYAELARHVLATRPDPSRLAGGDAALECLAQLHLGRGAEELRDRVPCDVMRWASATAALAPASAGELGQTYAVCGSLGRGRLAPVVLWGELLTAVAAPEGAAAAGPETTPSSACTERPSPPRPDSRPRVVDLGSETLDENPAVHSFEKVHTAEEYGGGKKRVDADDELAAHAEALDELDLREVVRSSERARSLYRCDVLLDGGVGDLEGGEATGDALVYDEWDMRTGRYRKGWCSLRAGRLRERLSAADAACWRREALTRHRAQIRALEIAFARLAHQRTWKTRQPDGPDVDVDAVVRRHAALRSGHAAPDRLYCARRRHAEDLAVLILLDASASTDAWIAGRRVLDVARESVLVLGDALATTSIRVGVAAFVSHTRRDCRFLAIKGFSEAWTEAARRLASVEASGYTRIGPALRHATAVLGRDAARRRLVLLVSDGKPIDYDRYEGRYGIADVRQAVREAQRSATGVFALAIDGAASAHLPRLFGHGNYAILPRPEALAGKLARVVADVLR